MRIIAPLSVTFSDSKVKSFIFIIMTFGIAIGLFLGVLNNYLHEVLSISRLERGIVEMPRELPGLLLFLIIAFLYRFSEFRIMQAALIISTVALVLLGFFGKLRGPAILFVVLWSTGEHMMMPVRQSIGIHLANPGKEGLAMGSISSFANIGTVTGHYLVPIIFLVLAAVAPNLPVDVPFRVVFFLAAGILFMAILFSWRMAGQHGHLERPRLVFKRKYLKYYVLETFFGARKQVFLTFAPYVLILVYGARTELVASLYGVYAMANIFVAPLLGRLIDRIGYKIVIMADAVILIVLCFLYGFSHRIFPERTAFYVVCAVFVLDGMLFVVGMARAMYARSRSETGHELTTALSSGISVNHLVSIVIAIAGGLLWEVLGTETLFSLAALFGAGSFLFSLTLEPPKLASNRQ